MSVLSNITWIPSGVEVVFKSDGVVQALKDAAEEKSEECNAHIWAHAHAPFSDSMKAETTRVTTKLLDHTAVGVIRPACKAARSIAAKHGII